MWCGLSLPALAECEGHVTLRPIPLPIIATQPNEGNTYGFMQVMILVCDETGRTEAIIAPSISWNPNIQWTGTMRYFAYPSDTKTILFTASLSTRINSNVRLIYSDLPINPSRFTQEMDLQWVRSAFYRFFGFGPDTPASNESSYTRLLGHATARGGYNLTTFWNAGIIAAFHRDAVQALGITGLPISPRVFPTAQGMAGATTLTELVSIRYDNRPLHEYSDHGMYFDGDVGLVEGIVGSPTFARGDLRFRYLQPELDWLSAAGRVDVSFVSSSRAPFYEQSSLGGEVLLRGYQADRFIDNNSWTIEAEERIRLLQLHIMGVTADWDVDPFIAFGQVFGGVQHAFSNPRAAVGVGLRAFVHPNVLGRVDLAYGGEGLNVYVELGYPY